MHLDLNLDLDFDLLIPEPGASLKLTEDGKRKTFDLLCLWMSDKLKSRSRSKSKSKSRSKLGPGNLTGVDSSYPFWGNAPGTAGGNRNKGCGLVP